MKPEQISIRTELRSGDLGNIIRLHGEMYHQEHGFGLGFEAYVAQGVGEFYLQYDPELDRIWIVEHDNKMVGCLALMHREEGSAQLRYYFLLPEYRGLGLGKKLMDQYMEWLLDKGFTHSYLLTTGELGAAAALYTRHGFVLTEEHTTESFGKPVIEQRYDWRMQAD